VKGEKIILPRGAYVLNTPLVMYLGGRFTVMDTLCSITNERISTNGGKGRGIVLVKNKTLTSLFKLMHQPILKHILMDGGINDSNFLKKERAKTSLILNRTENINLGRIRLMLNDFVRIFIIPYTYVICSDQSS
jgi:hypothetical protein